MNSCNYSGKNRKISWELKTNYSFFRSVPTWESSFFPHSSHCHFSLRSCQTCRNNATERKRYLSKSREAIFEKVSRNSNLKKSLSKSRERLCDMRLTAIPKSRENIHNGSSHNGGPQRKTSRDETAFRQSLSRCEHWSLTEAEF